MSPLVFLRTGDRAIDAAFRIAVGDIVTNVQPYQGGLLGTPEPVVMAGLGYRVWTRDSAINVWNGLSLLDPRLARNTLLCIPERAGDGIDLTGEYWDAIVWTSGAWAHYLYTGDRDFLATALAVTRHALRRFEREEFDPRRGLFRGPACYGDGVAAYPDRYAETGGSSSILAWPRHHPAERASAGYGIPMHALSTNCLYVSAYRLASRMAGELGQPADAAWPGKADALAAAIRRHFWDDARGVYRYLVDDFGGCDHLEGLGHALAVVLGVADETQARRLLAAQPVTPAGIPCVWPAFSRYANAEGTSFGRHSGTVWPHIQGFWAEAAARLGAMERFSHEFDRLTAHANRDLHFTELYHPLTGLPYGGLQEGGPPGGVWASEPRQTWSATAYLRMLLMGVLGMRFETDGVTFDPLVPPRLATIELTGLQYRGRVLDIRCRGTGSRIAGFRVDARPVDRPTLPAEGPAHTRVEIDVEAS